MYSMKAQYQKDKNLIELFDNVKIYRNNEIIVGDYAKINTLTESYNVKSNNKQKVKILINNSENDE
jgi:lipopolysaccharide export system protein LptA